MQALGTHPGTWQLLSSEPPRLMFFCGAVQLVSAMTWWLVDLLGRYGGWYAPFAWTLPPGWAHAWLLLYGLFPFFMFGFLMTAGPNWLGAPKPARSVFVPVAIAMASGVALVYLGLAQARGLIAAGILLHAAGWGFGLAALLRMLRRHWSANARYAAVMFVFFTTGLLGSIVSGIAIASASYGALSLALHGAVWFFLMPIYAGVSTRMVPFFSSRVLGPEVDYRPAWARPALVGGAIAHGVLQSSGAAAWLWLVDLPLAAAFFWLALKWGLARSAGVRLLAVLHISLAACAVAFLLYGILSAALAAGVVTQVGYAPLHLLTIGFFAAMALAMVSRVSLGHSGRKLEADALTWGAYLAVLTAAIVRATAELVPDAALRSSLTLIAGGIALAAFAAWAWRYLPMYLTPRVDVQVLARAD